jgi:hypothetical protein
MTQATPPAYLKRSQYAAHIGRSPGYITQLAAQGRVVFTPDGCFVDVAKTNALLAQTADPAKQPVADRHAAARLAAAYAPQQPSDAQAYAYPQAPTHAPAQPPENAAGSSYQQARAVKERYLALDAKRAYEVAMGQLRDAREVEHAVATAFTTLRLALETLASTLAPTMAAVQTEEAARTELAQQFEQALASCSQQLAAMAAGPAAHNTTPQAHL